MGRKLKRYYCLRLIFSTYSGVESFIHALKSEIREGRAGKRITDQWQDHSKYPFLRDKGGNTPKNIFFIYFLF